MKKILFVLMILFTMAILMQGQNVSNYTYLLDNGVSIKEDHCWKQVWVSQSYEAITDASQTNPLAINIRTLGDLILPGSTIKLLSSGKEVKIQGAAAGTYDLKVTAKLSGKPGTLSFVMPNVVIKPKTKTSVSVTLYDYQYNISETAGTLNGLASYEASINCFKGSPGQNPHKLALSFYAKGNHDTKILPDEAANETKGKIKPGTFDILMVLTISGQKHEVWLENFTMKPNVTYNIGTNLNAGIIIYTGGNKEVKALHLYPAGTAAKQTAKPAPDKTREIISYDNVIATNACPPGAYDILLNFNNGSRYEWKKNIIVQTGSRAEIK